MKNLTLKKLSIPLMLVAIIYFAIIFMEGSKKTNLPAASKKIEWENVKKITLEKEGKSVEISNEQERWVLPSKHNFQASTSNIRAFLLKLMDFSSAQLMNITKDGLDILGLNEAGKNNGHGIITLSFGEHTEPVKIYLGSLRKRKGETMSNELNLAGQYLKYSSSENVYMLPLAINLDIDEKKWLDTDIVSIQSSEIYSIESFSLTKNDSSSPEFALTKSGNILSPEPKFSFSGKVPEGKVLQTAAVTQVTSGLEALTFIDVAKKDSEVGKKIQFDRKINFNLLSGKVYQLEIGKMENKHFISLKVKFDQNIVSKIEEIKIATEKANESSKEKANESKDSKNTNLKIQYSSQELAESENKKFENWIYEIPEFVSSRFSKKEDDFFNDKSSIEPKKPE